MPVAPGTLLAPNFTARELGADKTEATNVIVANLTRVAQWLQVVRGLLGVRVLVTSGFRPPPPSDETDHDVGLAADFKGEGLSGFQVYTRLREAIERQVLPRFDQLIWYAADNHVHVGLGERMRGQVLLRTTEGNYVELAGSYITKIRGYL